MTTQYKTAKEVMTLLLAGKKARKSDWDNNVYCHLFDGHLVDQDGDSTVIAFVDLDENNYWEEFVPPEERWDWEVGDCFKCGYDRYDTTYEVLFVNEKVCFCQIVGTNSPYLSMITENFPTFYNIPHTIKAMTKI